MTPSRALSIGVLTIVGLAVASTGWAQPSKGLHVPTPGARANAMGGTFIAIADDGSASIANPAGLMNLTRPQIYAEITSTKGASALDFSTFATTDSRVNSFSFLSVSMPVGSRATVGGTYNEFYNTEDSFTDVGFSDQSSAHGRSYGGSIAFSATPTFRVGATVTADHFVDHFSFADAEFGDFSGDFGSWSTGITLGGLWQANEKVAVGVAGAYGTLESGPPSHIGGGVAVRPSSRLLASADLVWTRVDAGDKDFDLPADTVTALHLGGEYAIPETFGQLFIRAGAFVGHETTDFGEFDAKNSGATFGAGIAAGQHFQMDFAYVTAYSRIVLSSGFRF